MKRREQARERRRLSSVLGLEDGEDDGFYEEEEEEEKYRAYRGFGEGRANCLIVKALLIFR